MSDPDDRVPPPPPTPASPPPLAGPPPLPDEPAAAAPLPLPGEGSASDDAAAVAHDLSDPVSAELIERALQHQTEQTRTYPCRQCGGELEFAIDIQDLRCPHCGNVEEIVDDEGTTVVEQDFRAALAALESGALARTGPQVAGEKEVVCQNCGGHTTFTGSLTATRCPYCATPIQRDDIHDAPTRLAVDGILPFAVDERAAKEAIDEWIDSRWFAPNEFKKYSTTGSFRSVYAAYFTYDAETTTRYTGQRGDNYTVTVGSGENRRTEVRTRWSYRAGTVYDAFDDLPVLANEGFDRRHIQALEPWPTDSAKPFSAEYVAGHLSRTYDHDVRECFDTAKVRIESAVRETVKRDIGGDLQRISSMSVHYGSLGYKHLLLPIWLLTVMYQQKPFQVFINGVTGEVHGERPWSAIKIAVAVAVALLIAGVLFVLYQSSGGRG